MPLSDKSSVIIHPFAFLSKWRSLPSFELISYVFMFASMPMLAYGIKPYDSSIITIIILSVLSLYSGFFAALIWNDITDAEIDSIAHPDRPIPSGRISSSRFFAIALVFSAMTFIFAFLVSIWCLALVGAAALFVAFHNRYLKKIIKLPAYSEIFTPVQWVVVVIFGFCAIWTMGQTGNMSLTLPIFGDKLSFNSFDFQIAMFFISGIIGFLLFYYTILSFVFLIPFLGIWLYTLYYSYRLLKADEKEIKPLGALVGRKGFNYFLLAYDLALFITISCSNDVCSVVVALIGSLIMSLSFDEPIAP